MYVRGIADIQVIHTMRKMKKGKSIASLYCITLPLFSDGILELYAYEELCKPEYDKLEYPAIVIGITKSREDALELIRLIIDEVYQNTGGFDVASYLRL